MKKILLLAPIALMVLAGCSPKESYDKPDPAPENSKFDSASDGASKSAEASNKGQSEQSNTDQ